VNLTICLITKGREEYLEPLLESLEGIFQFDWVQILVILNGTDEEISRRISQWAKDRKNVILETRETNDARPSILWPLVKKHSDGWCIFIADDDLFNFEILPYWQDLVTTERNLVAVSTAARVIDVSGRKTGEIRNSDLSADLSQVESVALSIHQPPFAWPTLFFDISKLPEEIPNSRYVFDWWVGIHLVLSGEIRFLDQISISYRNHPSQESHLASKQRKYFEAFIWFERLLESRSFNMWMLSLNEKEIMDFWRLCIEKPPIYGDSIYSILILNKIRVTISGFTKTPLEEIKLLGDFAFSNGVLLKNQDVSTLLRESYNNYSTESNVSIEFLEATCGETIRIKAFFSSQDSDIYFIGCAHSKSVNPEEIIIDCSVLTSYSPAISADLILVSVTDHLEKRGKLSFKITPKERILLLYIRNVRNSLPNPIVNLIRKILS
jgi:hypothetical protein